MFFEFKKPFRCDSCIYIQYLITLVEKSDFNELEIYTDKRVDIKR